MNIRLLLAHILVGCWLSASAQDILLDFNLKDRGADVSPDLFGIFFEEINHGGEGGLYGEAVVNRSFDDDYGSFYGWSSNDAPCTLVKTNLLNRAQKNACRTTFNSTGSWLRNSGFGGIKVVRDNEYRMSLWVRTEQGVFDGELKVALVSKSGSSCGSVTFKGPFTSKWQKLEGVVKATRNDDDGALQLQVSAPTTLVFDMVSCFPPTFKGRENGMRADLGQMLADMKPRFMRFPGGCYVEGRTGWGVEPNNNTRWEWKKTIGPVEERPGHRNQQWGYWVSDGQGYHEFLQFCEDIDAAPMFVCNVGMGHGWMVSYNDIGVFVREVLDAIEYANGDTTTVWGRERAKNGHPEPFGLKYVEIGNENCNFNFGDNSDQSDHYFERYLQFYNAIKANYPEVITIANVEAWGTDFPSWRSNMPVELVDEHYYRDCNFYFNNYNKYDNYPRSGAGVYVGEYAANVGGGIGNLRNALSEAVFMQGMENNSDVVKMASFAPIFMHETYGGWQYDIIRFNHKQSYGIPSYHVQKMFGNYQGKTIVPFKETNNKPHLEANDRQIGVGTWKTAATFTDVLLESTDGQTLFSQKDYNSAVWVRGTGTWAYSNGSIKQTNASTEGATYMCKLQLPNGDYNYSLKATKTSGTEGFLVIFNYKDSENYTWWNIGGWGNTAHGVENCLGGARSTLSTTSGSLETGHTYDVRVEKRGNRVRCYLDNVLMHDVEIPAGYAKGVYVSASKDDDRHIAIVKLTNPNPASAPVRMTFGDVKATGAEGEILTSAYVTDENVSSAPERVVPKPVEHVTAEADGSICYEAPAYSFTVLQIEFKDMPPSTEAQIPTPVVSYTFEKGLPVSDDGKYPVVLSKGVRIKELQDHNHVLWTGNIGEGGFASLGKDMPQAVFSNTRDYSISLDILNRADNNLAAFCWALAVCNGTDQYLGIINAANNRDWYYEVKNGSVQGIRTGASMRSDAWHNVTYVQQNGVGRIYVDGCLRSETTMNILPSDFYRQITSSYLGRSPFTADAIMENTYFDNLLIFNEALQPQMVAAIARRTGRMADDYRAGRAEESPEATGIISIEAGKTSPAHPEWDGQTYDLSGRHADDHVKGLVIKNGKKINK